jgi:UDP-N-acetylglucosamine 2-epimerase
VLVIFGTRPEVIKLAPVIRALQLRPAEFSTRVISTGQHREMVHQALDAFGLTLDVQFDAMASASSLGQLTSALFRDTDRLLEAEAPDWVLVQGDTTSAMVSAMSAFYRRIKVGHVEAGLRTRNRIAPFPEEMNRILIGQVADVHFAPTQRAVDNLRMDGVSADAIHLTGNTIVDALLWVSKGLRTSAPPGISAELIDFIKGRRMVLVTCHRRESFGEGLEKICRGLLGTLERVADAVIVYPVHPNPNVKDPVRRLLGGHPRIRLLEPVGYLALVWLMQESYCIFTDSGGIQEEAPSLGKPVLVLRNTTERPEVVEAGCARLVGTNAQAIINIACMLFDDRAAYDAMAHVRNPFGDGNAAERIVKILTRE